MRRSPRPAVALALLLAAGTGCNTWYNDVPSPDDLLAQVPWFDHMISSQAVCPYSRLGHSAQHRRRAPCRSPGARRTGPPSGPWPTPTTAGPAGQPDRPACRPSARGDTLYHTFCAVCHGAAGAGDGPVGPQVGRALAADRRAPAATPTATSTASSRYGRGIMRQVRRQDHRAGRPLGRSSTTCGSCSPPWPPAAPGGQLMSDTVLRGRLVRPRSAGGRFQLFVVGGGAAGRRRRGPLRRCRSRARRPTAPGSSSTSTGSTSPGWPAGRSPSPRCTRSSRPSGRAWSCASRRRRSPSSRCRCSGWS